MPHRHRHPRHISLDEARSALGAELRPVRPRRLSLHDCLGLRAATGIVAAGQPIPEIGAEIRRPNGSAATSRRGGS